MGTLFLTKEERTYNGAKTASYSAIKRSAFGSVLMWWMILEHIIQSEVSQKEKDKYHILMHINRI